MSIEDHNEPFEKTIQISEGMDQKPIIEEYEEKTAGFWMRFWAFIIDQLIVSALIGILVYPLFTMMKWSLQDTSIFAPISILSAIFYYGYFVLMTKSFQQTLGKMIFGIKVQTINGEKLNWSTVIFREIVGRFISNTVFILYLLVVFMPKNNSIADYFADTVVIHENIYIKKKPETYINRPVNVL